MDMDEKKVILTADIGYGDAGKGSIVDFLTRATVAHTVVRYNGGAQAAHNVVTSDGKHHTFAQFGSGTFLPGTRTHLSRFMLLHPAAMLAEERALRRLGIHDAFARTSIEREALVITPYQQAANRLKEIARGEAHHGSCGMGIGETMSDWLAFGSDVVFAGDLEDRPGLARKLRRMREAKLARLEGILAALPRSAAADEERRVLEDPQSVEITAEIYYAFVSQVRLVERGYLGEMLRQSGKVIFEGAQGVLLDEWYGFYPYNSWSTLTFQNADALLAENGFSGCAYRLGILRGYMTRHGAGPFVTEEEGLTARIPDWHNGSNPWQRRFRVGYLDLLALRYALQVCGGVDGLAVTHLDRMEEIDQWKVCDHYLAPDETPDMADFFEIEDGRIRALKVPADPRNLEKQERLTRLLLACRPGYTQVTRNAEEYSGWIGESLGAPVAITSYGMTAEEKRIKQRVR
jgi:adenylosuccinate synthase